MVVKRKNHRKLTFLAVSSCSYRIIDAVRMRPIEAEHTPAIADFILFCFRYVYQNGNMNRTKRMQGRYRPQNADRDPQIS